MTTMTERKTITGTRVVFAPGDMTRYDFFVYSFEGGTYVTHFNGHETFLWEGWELELLEEHAPELIDSTYYEYEQIARNDNWLNGKWWPLFRRRYEKENPWTILASAVVVCRLRKEETFDVE